MTQMAHIHDAGSGETIQRPLTDDELAIVEINRQFSEQREQEREAKKVARAAVLKKLKLSEEEVALLLG